MYLPRGKLLALIAIVVSASMVMGTGAFTSVTAERSVDVKVSGDRGAYLSLQPSNGSNGKYAKMKNGQLAVNLDGSAKKVEGEGVNPNAVTTIDNVFTIRNQGTKDVKVKVMKQGNGSSDAVTFYKGTNPSDTLKKGKTLRVGDDQIKVGIKVDTRGKNFSDGTKLLDSIKVQANATDTGK